MPNNYYEIKMLRLKILYILAGWGVFIGIELFSAFFLNTLLKNLCVHSHLMPNTKDMIMCATYLAIIIFTLSFILDILLFSNRIRLRFWDSWGVATLFMIVAFLVLAIVDLSRANLDWINYINTLIYQWLVFPIYQVIIFLPIFAIAYFIWVFWLQKRKSYTPLSKRTHIFLYLLNLIPILNIVGFYIYIVLFVELD